ncbi:MAG TPA: ABC transporter ATP-binding protein [Steroidobacteraceae bacterium]|nr:ABC transporter ATP-binding protein [Steroidobacteraceae bacterium]
MTASERREGVGLLGLMTLGMLLETLSVGLVIPALAFMTQTDLPSRFPALARLLAPFGPVSREQLVVGGLLALVLIYVLKGVFLAFLTWRKLRFVFGVQAQMSRRLFAGYLRQAYTFHIQRNSAELIRNALGEVYEITHHGLYEALRFIAEILVILGILSLLLYIEPFGAAVSIATLGLFGGGFYLLTRKRMLRWGELRQVHERMRLQQLQEGFGGVKDLKLLGREGAFIESYGVHADGYARVGRNQNTLQELPRLMLEILAVGAFAALVIVMLSRGGTFDALLPTLGLFAAAAFRIMPSANRIMNSVQIMRHAMPVVGTLTAELDTLAPEEPAHAAAPLKFERELRVDGVSFSYPAADSPSLRDVSLTIRAGESVGFVGGSGSGKSTLIDVILGLLAPQSGSVLVDGVDVRDSLRSWQDKIGYVRQQIFLTDDTLRRNIAFGIPDADIDEHALQRALRAAQLEEFVTTLPAGLNTLVGERGVRLSGGQLQRIGIARALYHDPPVLVLDEATSALDTTTEREVMSAVRALHGTKTVIIVAHRLTTVADCDYLHRLEAGRIVQTGSPSTLIVPVSDAHRNAG